jgi:uncharacterized protein (AIM24 family)
MDRDGEGRHMSKPAQVFGQGGEGCVLVSTSGDGLVFISSSEVTMTPEQARGLAKVILQKAAKAAIEHNDKAEKIA